MRYLSYNWREEADGEHSILDWLLEAFGRAVAVG